MLNDPLPTKPKPDRTWLIRGARTRVTVETQHPAYGTQLRGWIRPVDIADTTGPRLAGHLVWQLTSPDHEDLGQVTGDYVTAEKALLDATTALED
jgi:hypothetical protein